MLVLLSPMVVGISAQPVVQHLQLSSSTMMDNTSPVIDGKYADVTAQTTLQTDLPVTTPYWTDLVDTEKVSNDGSGVYVAVLDTGLLPDWSYFFSEAHIAADLGIGFTHDISSYDPDTGMLDVGPLKTVDFTTELASGHGTHVTSTITGYNLNGEWVSGVAPGVTIIPVRVLDAWLVPGTDGNVYGFSGGFNDMIAAGIYYIADLAGSLDAPIVINMSLGGGYSSMIQAAIDYAISQGVIIVTSAGNSGGEGLSYPGALPESISVGAVGWTAMFAQPDLWRADVPERLYKDDSLGNDFQVYLEDFSSRPNATIGQTPDILDISAPGAWIVGPYKSAFQEDTSYYYLSGTSMASPHATAIAALVLQSFPFFDQHDVEQVLIWAASGKLLNLLRGFPSSGTDVIVAFPFNADGYYTATWGPDDFGAGFLNADAAMVAATLYALLNFFGFV